MKVLINQSIRVLFLALALTSPITLINPPAAHGESIGTSCADCPNYSGAFSIENNTGVTIPYQIRWGRNNPWQSRRLSSGIVRTHSYPLGEDRNARIPTPYIRFDNIGGDGRVTPVEYRMEFYATGYAGFTDTRYQNNTQPKRYFFRYAADGRHIELLAR